MSAIAKSMLLLIGLPVAVVALIYVGFAFLAWNWLWPLPGSDPFTATFLRTMFLLIAFLSALGIAALASQIEINPTRADGGE